MCLINNPAKVNLSVKSMAQSHRPQGGLVQQQGIAHAANHAYQRK